MSVCESLYDMLLPTMEVSIQTQPFMQPRTGGNEYTLPWQCMKKCQLATSNAKRTLLELVFILSVTMTDSCTTFSFHALEIAVCCYASNSVRKQHWYASNLVRQRCWYQGHCYLNCGQILFHILKKKKSMWYNAAAVKQPRTPQQVQEPQSTTVHSVCWW